MRKVRRKQPGKPKVVWTNKDVRPDSVAEHPYYVQTRGLDNKEIADNLSIGNLFLAKCNLVVANKTGTPFQVAFGVDVDRFRQGVIFPKGSVVMYCGMIRIQEKISRDKIVESVKHTFIIGGRKYIVEDLEILFPA